MTPGNKMILIFKMLRKMIESFVEGWKAAGQGEKFR